MWLVRKFAVVMPCNYLDGDGGVTMVVVRRRRRKIVVVMVVMVMAVFLLFIEFIMSQVVF